MKLDFVQNKYNCGGRPQLQPESWPVAKQIVEPHKLDRLNSIIRLTEGGGRDRSINNWCAQTDAKTICRHDDEEKEGGRFWKNAPGICIELWTNYTAKFESDTTTWRNRSGNDWIVTSSVGKSRQRCRKRHSIPINASWADCRDVEAPKNIQQTDSYNIRGRRCSRRQAHSDT